MAPIKHYLNQSILQVPYESMPVLNGLMTLTLLKHRGPPNFLQHDPLSAGGINAFSFPFFFKVTSAQIGFINVMWQITKVNVVLGVKIVVVFITEPCYFQSFRNSTSMYIAFSRQALLFTSGSRSCIAAILQTSQWRGPRHRCISCVQACRTYYRFFFPSIHSLQNLCAHSDTAIEHAR